MSYNVRRYDVEMLLRMSECYMKQKIFIHLLKVTLILLAKKKHLMHINLTMFLLIQIISKSKYISTPTRYQDRFYSVKSIFVGCDNKLFLIRNIQ